MKTSALAWIAIGLALAGIAQFALWVATAEWGQGGELGGMALAAGTAFSAMILAAAGLLGLIPAVMAMRRKPRPPTAIEGLTLNLLIVLVVLGFVASLFIEVKIV